MRYLINRWTEHGIVCLYGTDKEADFSDRWREVVQEYRPENARIAFNGNTTIFSFPDPGRKDILKNWERPEYIKKPESMIIYRKSTLKQLY